MVYGYPSSASYLHVVPGGVPGYGSHGRVREQERGSPKDLNVGDGDLAMS